LADELAPPALSLRAWTHLSARCSSPSLCRGRTGLHRGKTDSVYSVIRCLFRQTDAPIKLEDFPAYYFPHPRGSRAWIAAIVAVSDLAEKQGKPPSQNPSSAVAFPNSRACRASDRGYEDALSLLLFSIPLERSPNVAEPCAGSYRPPSAWSGRPRAFSAAIKPLGEFPSPPSCLPCFYFLESCPESL
jgi:hypothetical protein